MIIIRSLQDSLLPLKNTAVALGVFDGLHMGHRKVLRAVLEDAKENGRTPCVMAFALSDPPPRYKEGAVQLVTQSMLKKLFCRMGIRYAFAPAFEDIRNKTPREFAEDILVKSLGAELVSCGYNFSFGKGGAAKAEELCALSKSLGVACAVVPEVDVAGGPVSSSRVRACIRAGDIPDANELLGWPFSIDFVVEYGNRIGHTLGFPTINQVFPPNFVVPRHGVYATVIQQGGISYAGVTNVGVKPTIGNYKPLAETYIHGFSGDLYGRKVEVSFLRFIRPEQKFSSLEKLRANILRDAAQAQGIAEEYLGRFLDAGR